MSDQLRTKYASLINKVRFDHVRQGFAGGHHDFLHAFMVAEYALMIAESDEVGVLAWIAGICHNTDHLFPAEIVHHKVSAYIAGWTALDKVNAQLVINAVMQHSKLNDPNDDSVTVTLKDADRLANLGPNVIIRSGQHFNELPAFNPLFISEFDPTATYRNPKSVLRDVLSSLEWEDWIRLPKARELARPYVAFLKQFKALMLHQLQEVRLDPYPFPEDYKD
ncbi:hypothetical protein COT97_00060 [Candidatus Falkowbacteria bacterium CG10_big_fil_rev_8_21_14_0_10_39_11]|uniref:HD/PDEase domain-containing protein n=1 Tax=Candidatus Falkowbacteria bacterium CG10_big_fil_rev_8_21_14_0_10_39_11 TaxID=1974565 RepID=A0A2H0V6D9_9BACT|nr:MAG: hypothetical protein COT97_00060 [Candidatus Falkowbacteria bacterium CG10_big_fil_rev_8_21_14_0_10_39_11]